MRIELGDTWIDPEEYAYPHGRMARKGRVRITGNPHAPNAASNRAIGTIRAIRCGIPDTFFTIPARLHIDLKTVRGFVSVESGANEFTFTPEAEALARAMNARKENVNCVHIA